MTALDRRTFLAITSGGLTTGLAGCSGGSGDSEDGGDGGGGGGGGDDGGGSSADICGKVSSSLTPFDVSGTAWVTQFSIPSELTNTWDPSPEGSNTAMELLNPADPDDDMYVRVQQLDLNFQGTSVQGSHSITYGGEERTVSKEHATTDSEFVDVEQYSYTVQLPYESSSGDSEVIRMAVTGWPKGDNGTGPEACNDAVDNAAFDIVKSFEPNPDHRL